MTKNYEKEFLLNLYQDMVRIRKLETKVGELFKIGKIVGTTHLSIGEEAIAVGACKALKSTDFIASTHRGHGHTIAKGGKIDKIMAELFGKSTGYCGGKGGSMHVVDVSLGILGANGIVGAGIPIAGGSALASKISGKDEVTICFFGDGASNHGTFHETVNMSAAWKLPVVFVCENNGYAVSVPIGSVTNTENLAVRAKAYNIPGITIDGNNVIEVYETVKEAVERARIGEGPSFIECKTFRHEGHNYGDTAWYRPKEYMEEASEKDAIANYKLYLLNYGITEQEIEVLEHQADVELENAIEFAEESPFPHVQEALNGVYTTDNERCVMR